MFSLHFGSFGARRESGVFFVKAHTLTFRRLFFVVFGCSHFSFFVICVPTGVVLSVFLGQVFVAGPALGRALAALGSPSGHFERSGVAGASLIKVGSSGLLAASSSV